MSYAGPDVRFVLDSTGKYLLAEYSKNSLDWFIDEMFIWPARCIDVPSTEFSMQVVDGNEQREKWYGFDRRALAHLFSGSVPTVEQVRAYFVQQAEFWQVPNQIVPNSGAVAINVGTGLQGDGTLASPVTLPPGQYTGQKLVWNQQSGVYEPSAESNSIVSLSFNGVDEIMRVPNHAGLNVQPAGFTLTGWARRTGNTGSSDYIIGFVGTNDRPVYAMRMDNNAPEFVVTRTVGNQVRQLTAGTVGNNQWFHFVAVYDANTGNTFLYVNGTLQATGNVPSSIYTDSTRELSLFGEYFSNSGYLDGSLGQAAKFDVPFTSSEALEAFNGNTMMDLRTHSRAADLAWYYRITIDTDPTVPNGVVDYSPSNVNGTCINMNTGNLRVQTP